MIYKKYGSYLVYEDGSCYSLHSNKFLKPCEKKGGYLQYTLQENGKKEVIRGSKASKEIIHPSLKKIHVINTKE